jgi:tetratricopeptide (TPR) repeat protein
MTQLTDIYRNAGRFKEALAISGASLQAVREAGRSGSMAELVNLNNHGSNLCGVGEYVTCAAFQRQALDLLEKTDLQALQPVGARHNYGTTVWRLGQPQHALELADADVAFAEQGGNRMAVALCHLLAARALLDLGRLDESLARLERAEVLWNADPRTFARMLQEAAVHRAYLRLALNDASGAMTIVRGALERARYPAQTSTPGLDRVLRAAAKGALQAGDSAAAERYATDALALSQRAARAADSSADAGLAALLRAEARMALGRVQEARADAELARRALSNGYGPEHADTRAAQSLLSRLTGACGVCLRGSTLPGNDGSRGCRPPDRACASG